MQVTAGGKGCHPQGPGQAGEVRHVNHVKFNKAKHKVLHLDQGDPKHRYKLGSEWIESRLVEKELGVLVDERLDRTQQSALAKSPRIFFQL